MNDWDKFESSSELREKIWSKNRSYFRDVMYRFFKKKLALLGMILIVLLLGFAFLGPLYSPYSYDKQSLEYSNLPPTINATYIDNGWYFITANLKIVKLTEDGTLLKTLPLQSEDPFKKTMEFDDEGTAIAINYRTKPAAFIIDGEIAQDLTQKKIWLKDYRLGTDALGRDMLTRSMYGTRVSLIVAFIATLVNMTIGIIYGGISAFAGGTVDSIMMRIVDIINTIPLTLYVILIMVVLDSGFLSIIIALSSVYWVNMARVVRGQIFSLKNNDFVLAARSIGSSSSVILFKHLLPNAMGPILVTATMLVPSAIFIEAFMSFIGLGIAPPMASLGTMCNDALQTLRSTPHQLFIPSILICLIMFAFNFVGDGLRDALDPKLKK
ncbi:MAG: ABC transporter permease [Saccharofermentanales bacterium]|jgi:oligopeptide transport system permease protein